MCGIAGFFNFTNNTNCSSEYILNNMCLTLKHRGPDDVGQWLNQEQDIGLGHTRLSILDLSSAGKQPMIDSSDRFVIAFNGEIYNHLEIRSILDKSLSNQKINWKSTTDTETLLYAFQFLGIVNTLKLCHGMFAISLLDRELEELHLIRDRSGEKPLYYGWQTNGACKTFLFASEIKALKKHPAFVGKINRHALSEYVKYGYVPAPSSIYENIFKLLPGSILTISKSNRIPQQKIYWDLKKEINLNPDVSKSLNLKIETKKLEDLLTSVIKREMVADVPVGAFLSGGVDSSLIAALMQVQSQTPVRTYTIGFAEENYNEANYARAVAQHLQTEHMELYVSPSDARNVIPKLPEIYDEPFADSSQIPTFLVAQLASKFVKVSLSGDGGDELFCGYNRYILANKYWNNIRKIPPIIRNIGSKSISRISPTTLDQLINPIQRLLPKVNRLANVGDKLHKAANVLVSANMNELYSGLTMHWCDGDVVLMHGDTNHCSKPLHNTIFNDVRDMMFVDFHSYLPDDILVKVDRASMANSLEIRAPFLDHSIIEFSWSLPLELKLKDGVGKSILRELLYKYVPINLIERPKMGFGIPIGDWLRGPLKEWASELLDPRRLEVEGFFDKDKVTKRWLEHLSGLKNWEHSLWIILMFQCWYEENHEN